METKNRDWSKGYERAKPQWTQVICAVRVGFMSLRRWPSPFWSSDLYYWKELWTNKKIQWDYTRKYTSEKQNELLKYWYKKHWTQRIEKDWITQTLLRSFFFFRHFSPSKEQSIDFYSNQGLYFQYQKENDQECTVRNPALKSLGRWNEEGMGGS